MSKARKLIDEQANKICAQLGAAYLEKERVEEHISRLKSLLTSLNELTPKVIEISTSGESDEQSK